MSYKKHIVSILLAFFASSPLVYSAAPLGGYTPGTTNNPDCAPGDTDCFVQALVDTDAQTLSLSGSILSISNGNSVFLPIQPILELNSLTGAIQSFAVGDIGNDFSISSTGSTHTFNIPNASATSRGFVNTLSQSFEGIKTFLSDVIFDGNVTLGSALSDNITINGALKILDGNQAAGKILTSDASGNASWQNPSITDNQTLSLTGNTLSISNGNSLTLNYLTSYTEIDPIFSASPSFGIGTGSISNWNTAFGWGNHATQGYLTGSALSGYLTSETDPIFSASPSFGIGTGSISNWNTAFGWGNHATQGYLTSYTETDPIFSASPSFGIGTGSISNWNTAFGWGNHATQGYLTGSALSGYLTSETDPIFSASPSFGIGTGSISNWNTAFGWGNHATQGYLTSYTETDPIFIASPSFGIGTGSISNWNTAFGWGNHATQGYLTGSALSGYLTSETDPIFTASPSFGIGTGSIANWNTAFGWGDHATQGYLTSYTETDPIFTASPSFGIGTGSISNWNTAFGWGNHAAQGYLTGSALSGYLTSETDPIFTASPSFGIGTGSISNWNTAFGWGNHATQGYLTGTTTNVAEGTNLYYTNARGIGSLLTGFVSGSGTVTATDSVLQAIQKLQGSNTIQDTNISSKIGLTSLSANGPLSYNSGSGVFSISQATTGINGYLSSTDWNTFNSKLGSISVSAPNNGLTVTGSTLTLGLAGTSSTGALSRADWNTFNGKQNALTFGNISSSTPALSVINGTGASVGPNVSFSIANATGGVTGLLTSTDWNTFNSKIGLTSLSGISPIVYNNTNGQISWSGTTTNVAEGTNLYWTTGRFDTAFSGKTTTNLSEGTNLYYTNARGIGSVLTGFVSGSGTVTAIDSVLQAIQKLQGTNTIQDTNISAKIGLTSLSASGPLTYNSGSGLFSISQATTGTNGYLSSADWNTFNGKENTLTFNSGLTRSGSIIGIAPGANGQVLSTSGGIVTWAHLGGAGISSLNSLTGSTQTFAIGTGGTDFNISSTGSVHTFNIPNASSTVRGLVTILAQTFEGVKTFVQAPIFSSFTPGSVPFISTGGLLSQNNTNFFWDNTNQRLGVGTSSPVATFHVQNSLTSGIPTTATGILATNALVRYRSSNSVLSFLTDTNSPYGIGFQAHDANTGGDLPLLLQPVFGNVGIGIVNPSAKLEIKHGTAGNSGLRFTNLLSTDTGATNNSKQLSVNASGDVILTNDMRQRVSLSADATANATTTFASITGLSFPVTSGVRYQFECRILYNAALATTGSRWSITGPATPTLLGYTASYPSAATTVGFNNASAYDVGTATLNSAGTTGNVAEIKGIIKPSANGNVTVRFASELASAITPKEGSSCEYWSY